ncbi:MULTISPECIES: DUF3221 domain-containing protein [Saccharibacillus]|uniref:DUF3221 domain-containing protein n=1 Tax=Saccharibacillus TaxID=456492 RepID=UPI001238DC39|nr:DUF3221 domain-containing protein [Saccharibacillus sp. WB 17]MWJ31371.1 DUF3221 domain-containing protein [Saccharibacillus sp. WB 17]
MIKYSFIFIFMMTFLVGCQSNNKESANSLSENWDQQHGIVILKENERILVTQDANKEDLKINNVEKILNENKPNAIFLAIPKNIYEKIEIGYEVEFKIKGSIDFSYPAQATAEDIKIIRK